MATLAMLQSLLPALVLLGGFAAAPQQWHPRSPCVDDTDCALNGACSAGGACTCSSGWSGPACETLELLPAQPVGAYGYAISSWGAVVVAINDTYHMYAAEFWNNCGVQSFYTNCRIVHAEATRPEGPFRYICGHCPRCIQWEPAGDRDEGWRPRAVPHRQWHAARRWTPCQLLRQRRSRDTADAAGALADADTARSSLWWDPHQPAPRGPVVTGERPAFGLRAPRLV